MFIRFLKLKEGGKCQFSTMSTSTSHTVTLPRVVYFANVFVSSKSARLSDADVKGLFMSHVGGKEKRKRDQTGPKFFKRKCRKA
uniref:Ribosomal protein S19/S15 n=1 Tax=Caenorhabditis tropicalis TaxID=1561998 RepID=A0A1I7T5U4_9PELO